VKREKDIFTCTNNIYKTIILVLKVLLGESIVFKEMNVVILLVVEKVLKGQKGNIYIYVEGPGGLKCQELCITRECPEKLESLE